jgi:sporulation protein YunB
LLIVFFIFTAIRFENNYINACNEYINTSIKGELTTKIHSQMLKYLSKNKSALENIIEYDYLTNGRISSVRVNTTALSLLINELTISIQNEIFKSNEMFSIPISNVLGSKLFAGKGPRIKMNINESGVINYKIENQLVSGGINQAVHRVSVVFNTEIKSITPFEKIQCNVENVLIISETLIVGEIPEIILPSVK